MLVVLGGVVGLVIVLACVGAYLWLSQQPDEEAEQSTGPTPSSAPSRVKKTATIEKIAATPETDVFADLDKPVDEKEAERRWKAIESMRTTPLLTQAPALPFAASTASTQKPAGKPPQAPDPTPSGGTDLRAVRTAAEGGDAVAQHRIGVACMKGDGLPKDPAEAFRWFTKSGEQGHADSQANLGVMYYSGQGVERNFESAAQWFLKAAKQGNAEAQFNYARCCQEGQGVPKSEAAAAEWYTKSADQGHASAQFNLGRILVTPNGALSNPERGIRYLQAAAATGHAKSQAILGRMYWKGIGVEKDPVEAEKWLRKAADNGVDAAKKDLEIFARERP